MRCRGVTRPTRSFGEAQQLVEGVLLLVIQPHISVTGKPPPACTLHRTYFVHSLLRMTSDDGDGNRTVVFADPPGTNNFVFARVPIAHMNQEFIDAAFTKAISCEYPGGCEGLMRDHRFADTVPLGEHWKHKYLIDVDGMGYSARLFAFLASDSAVIKATVYREYFSDWIQPWCAFLFLFLLLLPILFQRSYPIALFSRLHYIPLSQAYSELYNIHAYFSGPSDYMTSLVKNSTSLSPKKSRPKQLNTDEQLRRIARAGRRWKQTIGRKLDMESERRVHCGGASC